MKKLVYEKYVGMNNIITIDLLNGYTIIAIIAWKKETNSYKVELRLKDNQICDWKSIEKAENLEFKTNSKRINSIILKQVATFLQEGFFDYYIKRCEYEVKCFDIGNEKIEKERLGIK